MVHRNPTARSLIKKWLGLGLVFSACCGTGAWGAPVDIASYPLQTATAVRPNIMLMIDNSGSMNNIVPDLPFDPATVYLASCPSGNRVSTSSQVDLRIVSGGPRINISGSSYAWGTSSGQRCFETNSKYMAKLNADGGSAPSGYLPAEYSGNYLNWYFQAGNTTPAWTSSQQKKPGTDSRMEIAKGAATALLDNLDGVRVGISTYNGSNGASILQGMTDVVAGRAQLKTKVASLSAVGMTPLAEALRDLGEYFALGQTGPLVLYPESASPQTVTKNTLFAKGYSFTPPAPAPIEAYCQKNFVLLMTDGRPTNDSDISSVLQDYDGDCKNANPPCLTLDRKPGQDYESSGTDFLDDVAAALRDIDLRPDLNDPTGKSVKNNLSTYTIGFADDQVINDPLMKDTAANGGGQFLTAGNQKELLNAFQDAANIIISTAGSSAAGAANSTSYRAGTKIYQASYDTARWSGEVKASTIDKNGKMTGEAWLASSKVPTPADRKIFTFRPSTQAGGAFSWADLDPSQQAFLNQNISGVSDGRGSDRLGYLSGARTLEGSTAGDFRLRNGLLGDIVNSDPFYAGTEENYGYAKLSGEGSSYNDFLSSKKNRRPMVYVGANDGMLHGFDADSGQERFAYVPNGVYPSLSRLTAPNYVHQYYVDGPPMVADAYVGGSWRSILVGSLGAGGRSVFALDVSNPEKFGAANVLWEVSHADLGLVLGPAAVVRLDNGDWVALFGNGYNSASETAKLFVVNLETKAVTIIATDSSTSNGLGPPMPVDLDGDLDADAAYAGDLQGNLWKFDLTGNSNNWKVAYKQGNTPKPLFTARDPNGRVQPITTRPTVGQAVNGDILVLFGTGKFIGSSDLQVSGTSPVHSFYGIKDQGAAITYTNRNGLQVQTIVKETSSYRLTSKNQVADNKDGWYIDLIASTKQGEMVVSPALLVYGKVVFTTLIPPKGDPCQPKGDSWLMVMDALTGVAPSQAVLDRNQDGTVDKTDDVPAASGNGADESITGSKQDGIVEVGGVIETDNDRGILMLGEKGEIMKLGKGPGQARQSWRQLR